MASHPLSQIAGDDWERSLSNPVLKEDDYILHPILFILFRFIVPAALQEMISFALKIKPAYQSQRRVSTPVTSLVQIKVFVLELRAVCPTAKWIKFHFLQDSLLL